jgi:hypothetical protein
MAAGRITQLAAHARARRSDAARLNLTDVVAKYALIGMYVRFFASAVVPASLYRSTGILPSAFAYAKEGREGA